MRLRRATLYVAVLMLAAAGGCKFSFTTANISSLKLSKDEEGKNEASSFGPGETVYAIATVSNVPSKVTLKFRFITENVQGQPANAPVEAFDRSFDVPRDGYVRYFVSPPPRGWPPGKYRIEVAMLTGSGEQKDQESATFTVSR